MLQVVLAGPLPRDLGRCGPEGGDMTNGVSDPIRKTQPSHDGGGKSENPELGTQPCQKRSSMNGKPGD